MRRRSVLPLLLALAAPARAAETSVAIKHLSMGSTVTSSPLLDDFNDGLDPNLWGGAKAAFSSPSASITASYDAAQAFGGTGQALALAYNLPNGGDYAGCAVALAPSGSRSLAAYAALTFRVKGAAAGQNVKIELKNAGANADRNHAALYLSDYLDGGVTTAWTQVAIPLKAFASLDSTADATELVFVFERDSAAASGFATAGTLYIDDIAFGAAAVPLRVDHFGDNWGAIALGGNMGDMAGDGAAHAGTFDAGVFHDAARGLRSQFDVSAPGAWSGFWMIFGGGNTGAVARPVDLTGYTALKLWVRGVNAAQTPARFKIELQDASGAHTRLVPDETTTPAAPLSAAWREYTINLSAFPGLDRAGVRQMNVVYENAQAAPRTAGVLYFDEIRFE